jgi:hypothetical protein
MTINNNIQEDYCSFEVSKLLKEKGFECETRYFSLSDGKVISGANYNWNQKYDYETNQYSRPTHALAIEWIRVNFNIAISTDNLIDNKYYFSYRNTNTKNYASRTGCSEDGYDSPQEATEAALLYTLQKLI